MVGKNNQYLKTTKQGTKVESYSIKKFKVGAASVVIGASIFLGAGAVAQASEEIANNTTVDNTTNAAAKEEAPKAVEKAVAVENTKESVVEAVAEKVGAETPKQETAKAEVKVNKEILKASIATLEEKLKSAQDADKTAVDTAKEVLEKAKAVLENEAATQVEVDAQVQTVQALSQVVTEAKAQAFDKKLEEKKAEEKKEKEAKATKEEKEVVAAKKELTQVASEAKVTNVLANEAMRKNEVKLEAKPAVVKTVAKNEEVVKVANELLGNDKATKEQISKSLAELSESIKAVYAELENAGVKRNGKYDVALADEQATSLKDASTETGKAWLEQHGYSSLADIKVKTKEDNLNEIKALNDQIQWLDFADTAAWTGLNEHNQLQVGSTYTKQLIPGYIVTMTVKELKPFETTEIYKNRVAGTNLENTYVPDKENKFNPASNGPTGLGANPQNRYTHTNNAGLSTGTSKTTIAGTNPQGQPKNGQAAGVKFDVKATYNGKAVKPGIVMTSREDIGPLESEIYTTDGTPWELAAIVGYSTNKNAYVPLDKFKDLNGGKNGILTWNDEKFYNAISSGKFATPDSATAGLGSQVFGGYRNNGGAGTPVLSTANVTEVGLYIMSSGQQSSMIGVKFSDFGDLPESYGTAEHFLRTETVDYLTKKQKQIQQPYLGTEKGDIDSAPGVRVRGIGSDDQNDNPDEGVKQLIDPADVHENKDTGEPEVKLVKAPDDTYEVNITASVNGNPNFTDTPEKAYVRGFIDFNQNGKFDEGEASEIVEVTENNQKVKLKFSNTQIIDTTKEAVNFRVRIAKERSQIEKPVGIAFSGEVEDNQIQVALPPRGDKEETTGAQGEKQTIDFEFVNRPQGFSGTELGSGNGKTTFNSYGKIYYSEQRNEISIETTKKKQAEGVMIVNPDGTLTKTFTKAGQGTYEVTDTGVTFTPEKSFTGQATGVTVKREDKNGTPVTATYTPVVLPVTPTAKDVTSIGEKGEKQSETPVFKAGTTKLNGKTVTVPIDEKVAPTFEDGTTTKEVPGEGTYTIDKNGKVTFTPEKDFVGQATGVTVKRVDENGTPVTAKYTPTVLGKTTTKDVTSEGAKNTPQSNTPEFKGDVGATVPPTFEDGTTEKVVPGEGTYTIDKDGKVTFTPEKDFVGTATPVEVVRKDKNGRTIKASYTPTVRPDTKFVVVGKDGKETELLPSKDGENPSEKVSGYKVVKTEKDEKGNTKHIYEKVTTKHVDSKGNPIPGTTTEEGTTDPKTLKEVPGYKLVETKTLPNGDTEHVYEKVKTNHVDKDGHSIPDYPEEEGTNPKKDIPGYKFVETRTLDNGDTEHVYEKVTTTFKDKEGNEIPGNPTEEGEQPNKVIPGYKFVETKKLPNGDTEHVYEKVKTSFKDKEGNVIPNYPTEEGENPKKDIPGYRFVETKKLPNGDTEHVYEKVTTVFKDKEGNVIPGTTTETGEQPKKDISGYKFVETKKLPNGDIEHVYERVTTPVVEKPKGIIRDKEGNPIPGFEYDMLSPVLDIPEYEYIETVTDPDGTVRHIYRPLETVHKDKEGNPIPNVPATEKGLKGSKDIPGYRLVETKKLPNGDVEHIYEKVNATTTWTDENGNPIKSLEKGSVEAGTVSGYEFVRTEVDKDGNVRHIFRKVTPSTPVVEKVTTWTDEEGNTIRVSEKGTRDHGEVPGYEFVRTVEDKDGNVRHIFRKVTAATPKAQVKRLANTGSETSNTAAVGFGALLAGIAAAIRKRKKED